MELNQELIPNQAIHPGFYLKEELAERGIKQNELAADIGIAASQLNEILKGKRSITPELAIILATYLQSQSATWWNNLQANYNLIIAGIEEATKEKVKAVENWKRLKELIPVSYFRKEDVLAGNPLTDIKRLLEILDFDSFDEMIEEFLNKPTLTIHFRKSAKLQEHSTYINSWVRYLKYLASAQTVPDFDFNSEKQVFNDLKRLFLSTDVERRLCQLLNSYGIKVLIKSKPDKVPIDGAAFWIDNNPVVVLTLRYHRLDNLVFTVYHELCHVYRHLKNNKSYSFVDDLDNNKGILNELEEEANACARDAIVSPDDWKAFVKDFDYHNDKEIIRFAKLVEAPAVSVWGRLCFEGRLSYNCTSELRYQNKIP